jgi:Flp pilus assembly protein TadG
MKGMVTMRFARGPDERGAMAVIVTLMATLLLAMAAFSVDLANAFAAKRQLSVAADASAIAGAQEVNKLIPVGTTTCDAGSWQPAAEAAANSQNTAAQPDATLDEVSVDCSNWPTDVRVKVVNRRDLPTFFGQFAGQSGFSAANTATARIFVPDTGVGLRPIAACVTDTTAANIGNDDNPFVVIIQKDDGICGSAATGEWAWVNFLDQGEWGDWNQSASPIYYPAETCAGAASPGGGNQQCQEKWVEFGYGGPVKIPNRTEEGTDPGNGTGADVVPEGGDGVVRNGGGIAGNDGNPSSVDEEVKTLVGKTIDLPVAKVYYGAPDKRIDIVGAVTVTVCSVKVGKNSGDTVLGAAPTACGSQEPLAGDSPAFENWDVTNNNEAVLWVKPVLFTESGTVGGAIDDGFTSPSDFGRRAVQLFK